MGREKLGHRAAAEKAPMTEVRVVTQCYSYIALIEVEGFIVQAGFANIRGCSRMWSGHHCSQSACQAPDLTLTSRRDERHRHQGRAECASRRLYPSRPCKVRPS